MFLYSTGLAWKKIVWCLKMLLVLSFPLNAGVRKYIFLFLVPINTLFHLIGPKRNNERKGVRESECVCVCEREREREKAMISPYLSAPLPRFYTKGNWTFRRENQFTSFHESTWLLSCRIKGGHSGLFWTILCNFKGSNGSD